MSLAISHCRFLHRETGATICLIGHTGKNESRGLRGWSGVRAAADAEIEVWRTDDVREWRVTKMRDGSDEGISGQFTLDVVNLGTDENFDPITSCVVRHITATPKKSTVKPRTRPQGNQLAALQYLEGKRVMLSFDEIADEIAEQMTASKPKYKRDRLR